MNDEFAARRLGRLLREESAGSTARAGEDPELARLMRAVSVLGVPARPAARRWLWPAAALAAMLVAALGIATLAGRRDLTYDVTGVARIEDRDVSADSGEAVQVRFSDGSTFSLQPGGRLRIGIATPDGTRLVLLRGETTASVVHRARSRWVVAAGPFEVVVVGTRFDARWNAEAQRLSVRLHEGAVEVKGGRLTSPVAVRAGQRLEVDATANDWRITPLVAGAEPPSGMAAHAGEPPAAAPAPSAPAAASAPGWQALMSRSDFAAIVDEARAMGVDRCLVSCSPSNLRILADAARYTGKVDIAEKSLLALRRRSPGQAPVAAFFLGRLYESEGRNAEALRMYDRRLADGSGGDYAEEATAGRMRVLVRLGDASGAREAAERYLRQYPGGVHVSSARRVIDGAAAP
jgi:transmembrane sensor